VHLAVAVRLDDPPGVLDEFQVTLAQIFHAKIVSIARGRPRRVHEVRWRTLRHARRSPAGA
jgi:hypothetical protein